MSMWGHSTRNLLFTQMLSRYLFVNQCTVCSQPILKYLNNWQFCLLYKYMYFDFNNSNDIPPRIGGWIKESNPFCPQSVSVPNLVIKRVTDINELVLQESHLRCLYVLYNTFNITPTGHHALISQILVFCYTRVSLSTKTIRVIARNREERCYSWQKYDLSLSASFYITEEIDLHRI